MSGKHNFLPKVCSACGMAAEDNPADNSLPQASTGPPEPGQRRGLVVLPAPQKAPSLPPPKADKSGREKAVLKPS